MAKVIVPKNYIYNLSTVNAGKSISTIFTSSLNLLYSGTFMYLDGVLCNDISIDYGLGNSTSSVSGGNQTITIQNDLDLVGRCLIVDITNLPKFQNTSTSSTRIVTLVFKHKGTSIQLKRLSVATSTTNSNTYGVSTSLNGKYYVNLLTNTATQTADLSECCKAIVPKNWIYPTSLNANLAYNQFTYSASLSSTMISNINIPKYLGCGINITWENVPTDNLGKFDVDKVPEVTDTEITLNISEAQCRFVKLVISNFPAMKNSLPLQRICNLIVKLRSGTSIIVNTTTAIAGSSSSSPFIMTNWADGVYWIDLKNKTEINPSKAITTV